MTIHFHGSPITGGKGGSVASVAHSGAGAFVSYAHTQQINLAFDKADTVCIDNGAFSKKNTGRQTDWNGYYNQFLPKWIDHPKLRFFVIPDDISGDDQENDRLIAECPKHLKHKGAPVWHMHESIDKFTHLCNEWEHVCIGSSGEYFSLRSVKWKARMREALEALALTGYTAKLHGLRMLDGRVLGNYPLDQADSTNLAINVGKWKAKYVDMTIEACRMHTHPTRWTHTDDVDEAMRMLIDGGGTREQMMAQRCAILKSCIEAVKPPSFKEWIERVNSTNC